MRHRPDFRSNQKQKEIEALLGRVAELRPNRICEIGADYGGTIALFASVADPAASLLSIDVRYHVITRQCTRYLKRQSQRMMCLEADSHSAETLSKAKSWLGNQPLDFLFIDGDHSYDGVKADFEMYGPMVRSGGIIAFHDIMQDFKTRYGQVTLNDVGEVPRFWNEIRSKFADAEELIEDPEQDGYGIGVVRVP
jgi:predicted O-methyltransferase YrrM